MNTDSIKSFVRSHTFISVLAVIGALIIVLSAFEIGFIVGYHEATFSSRFGENYQKNFGGTFAGMPDGHQPTPHGIVGRILTVSSSTIVIANTNQPEQTITIDSGTVIRNGEDTVTLSSLSTGDYAVVVGSPDSQGRIDAKLIRILPAPPPQDDSAASTTP